MSFDRKSNRHDFHESYYDHSCAIVEMKDVLITDIKENTAGCRLLRWWFGLFLLSYSDERSKIFYTSSHAIRMERSRQFRGYRGRIHPLSKFRNFWDGFLLITLILDLLTFNHNASITFGHISSFFYYIGAACDIIIVFDVFVNMRTGYIDRENRKIILDKYEGLLRYCSTKLFFHAASAIPIQSIIILRYGTDQNCSLCKTNKFIASLKIISIFRLFRLYEISSYLSRDRMNYKLSHFLRFFRIYLLGTFTMLQFLNLGDICVLLSMIYTGQIEEDYPLVLLFKHIHAFNHSFTNYKIIVYNFARIGKAILLYNFGQAQTKYYNDKTITFIGFVIINIFYFWLFLEWFLVMSRLKYTDDMVIVKQRATENMVSCRQLPEFVTRKLKKYYEYNQAKMKIIENENGLLKSLPPIVKQEIFRSMYLRHVVRIPYFAEWPSQILNDIVEMLKEEIYLKDDMVAEPGVPSEGLIIVAMGELAVYDQNSVEIDHLIDGDYIGELSLVTDSELRTFSAVALSPCVILTLDKCIFRPYMRHLPGLFYEMKRRLKDPNFNNARNKIPLNSFNEGGAPSDGC